MSINKKVTQTFNSANPNVATVTGTRTALATTLACDNLAGWPTDTVHFSTYQIDSTDQVVDGTQIDWKGIVSGNNIGSLERQAGAADTGNAIGDIVEMNPTASWAQDLYEGFAEEHDPEDGTHTDVTADTLTVASHIDVNDASTAIRDSSDNELVKFAKTASAVNEVTVTNSATGNPPIIAATGGDANIPLRLSGKGTGAIQLYVNSIDQLGAWQTWAPTLANMSGGTLNYAKYQQVGKTVYVKFKYTFASAGMGTAPTITLPVTAAADTASSESGETFAGTVSLIDNGTAYFVGAVMQRSTTVVGFRSIGVSGTNQLLAITSTAPFTWGANDFIEASFFYEAA